MSLIFGFTLLLDHSSLNLFLGRNQIQDSVEVALQGP